MAADLASTLPEEVEIGAVRRLDWGTKSVEQDNGTVVRNNRWSTPLRTFEISFPISDRAGSVYQAVLALYEEAKGGLYSFNFIDWTTEETVVVRFDSELQIATPTGWLDHIGQLVLRETRD